MAYYSFDPEIVHRNISRLTQAFLSYHLRFSHFYSVKTNTAHKVLHTISECGSHFEVVSSYEWEFIRSFHPKKVIYNGPDKNGECIEQILEEAQELYLNIDNDSDIELFLSHPDLLNHPRLTLGIRVFIDYASIWNRFGFHVDSVAEKISRLQDKIHGVHFHFNTNNFNIENYRTMLGAIGRLQKTTNIQLKYIDIGGGLPGAGEFIHHPTLFESLPELIASFFPHIEIFSEAGRYIISDAVNLESRVISTTFDRGQWKANIDCNILHFPCYFEKKYSLDYQSGESHERGTTEVHQLEIFGNSCMQVDKIGEVLIRGTPQKGDHVRISNIGAYSFSQAANFISKIPPYVVKSSNSKGSQSRR